MPQQHTAPAQLQEAVDHWTLLAKSHNPIVAGAARELLDNLRRPVAARATETQRGPADWAAVIDQVIADEPHHSESVLGFKTGHGYAHSSKSGTCVTVDLVKGLWYCSSCRTGGTTITWVMERDGVSRSEAWDQLADQFGAARA